MRSAFASLNWGRPTASKRAVYRLRLTDTSVEENMSEQTFAEAGIDLPYPQTVLHFGKPQPGDIDPHTLGGRSSDEQQKSQSAAAATKPFNPQTQGPAPSGPDVGGGPDN